MAAGVAFAAHLYAHDPAVPSYGLEAAQALGVEPGRVFKTLLVVGEGAEGGRGSPAVGVVPVDRQLDLKALASALGVKRVAMAEPSLAERVTGYVVGGISPIVQRRLLPTVCDVSVADHETVFVSGGRRGFDVELAPADLLAVTGGRTAAIAR